MDILTKMKASELDNLVELATERARKRRSEYQDTGISMGDVRLLKQTNQAILVELNGRAEWIPKTMLHPDNCVDADYRFAELILEESYAKQKGWWHLPE